jgi:hypothetical protein
MREFSLDLDKITKTIFFCKKVFVSTCLHCFNAATPLKGKSLQWHSGKTHSTKKRIVILMAVELTEVNILWIEQSLGSLSEAFSLCGI